MAADRPNPLDLTAATRLPPSHSRTFSRSSSPARSPARRAKFAARELDPLLKNLSPDSTLEALQKTNTIGSSPAEQSALAQSISDASESERELGIRAAIAAKKLKEWTQEVNTWTWPDSSDRAWGAGFVPKQNVPGEQITYLGSLPEYTVQHYQDRLDEIWDAMDTLGMGEIKEYVFSSHHPTSSVSISSSTAKATSSGYGRMRDFTALITATVVQSLPVLANLYVLLETWSNRLAVLRQIPDLLIGLQQVRQGLVTINDIIHDEHKSRKVTPQDFEQGKAMFGNRVSTLGKRVDQMLDMLEGQDDSLPQAWIDSLEDIEGKYAEWVAKAEQVIMRNQMKKEEFAHTGSPTIATLLEEASTGSVPMSGVPPHSPTRQGSGLGGSSPLSTGPAIKPTKVVAIKRKPLMDTNPRVGQGHKRGVSELSAAESNNSVYSLENAEIADAQKTTMLSSPHISLVDSSLPHNKKLLLTASGPSTLPQTQVDLPQRSLTLPTGSRSRDAELQRSVSNPTRGIYACNYHRASSLPRVPTLAEPSPHNQAGDLALNPDRSQSALPPLAISPSPSLRVNPLKLRGKQPIIQELDSRPSVPRRSSKRLSLPNGGSTDEMLMSPISPQTTLDSPLRSHNRPVESPSSDPDRQQTFDDKLKSILASMPNKIKLTDTSDSESASGSASGSSTRASSPMQTLKLCPVRDSKAGRSNTSNTSGIHVYHLSKPGKSRDSPPIKLFVRAVGEHGERLMVRVGGGWADLAEYLREYSLHHGGRGVLERQLEVANYPGQPKQRANNTLTFNPIVSVREIDDANASETSSAIDQPFDFGLPGNHSEAVLRPDGHIIAGAAPGQDLHANTGVLPTLSSFEPHARSPSPTFYASSEATPETELPRMVPGLSTTISPVPYTNRYTPLGAAGPVQNPRRAVSYNQNRSQSQPNKVWVEGMVNQARAVSGGHGRSSPGPRTSTTITTPVYATRIIGNIQIVEHPTITTTTTISSSRRIPVATRPGSTPRTISNSSAFQSFQSNNSTPMASSMGTGRPSAMTSPAGSQLSNITDSSVSDASYMGATNDNGQPRQSRPRRSFGEVSGVRRVFLRNKNDRS